MFKIQFFGGCTFTKIRFLAQKFIHIIKVYLALKISKKKNPWFFSRKKNQFTILNFTENWIFGHNSWFSNSVYLKLVGTPGSSLHLSLDVWTWCCCKNALNRKLYCFQFDLPICSQFWRDFKVYKKWTKTRILNGFSSV